MHKTIQKYVIANSVQVKAICAALTAYVAKTQQQQHTFSAQDAAYAQNAMQQFAQHKNLLTLFNALTMQDTIARENAFYAIVNYCATQKSTTVQKFTFNYINTLQQVYYAYA